MYIKTSKKWQNALEFSMIIIGIAYAICTGNMEAVTNGVISSSKEAINLSITMLGVVSLWMGLMEIAEKSGIMAGLVKVVEPFVVWFYLFVFRY